MKRIVVLGGTGFFGSLIVEKLRAAGLEPLVASRSGDLRIDADQRESLRAHLKQRDLVIDAAGPFQKRTSTLIETAASVGFDVIDLNDCPEYTSMILKHEAPIAAAGIRVLTACSSLSTVSAAVLGLSSVTQPRRITAYLRPASRHTANRASVSSFFASITGQARTIHFGEPLGTRSGLTVRSVDSITLPRVFPSLREMELVVDAGIPWANMTLRHAQLRKYAVQFESKLMALARRVGPKTGILAYEIVSTGGHKYQFFTGENAHLAAVLPAVLAAQSIATGRFPHRGVVPSTQHVATEALFNAMNREGIAVTPAWA